MAKQLPCPALYAGHDAGNYTLPAEVLKARDTFRSIEAMPWPKPPRNPWETVQDIAQATVDAIHNGSKLPDVERIEKARAAERIYQDALDMMGACLDLAAQRAEDTLRAHAFDILVGHLQPAHDDAWAAYKDAHRILTEYGETEPRRLLSAPAKVRKASDACDLLADRYGAIREAYGDLRLRCGLRCEDDPTGKYATVRNYHELHPTRWVNARPPWHGLSRRQFLDWMAQHDGQLWLPTPDEQTEAVQAEAHLGNPLRRAA